MLSSTRSIAPIIAVLVFALTACAQPAPQSAPPPVAPTNGGEPTVDGVVVRPSSAELPTVEVVKILKPSVVQIVTEGPYDGNVRPAGTNHRRWDRGDT